MPQTKTRTIAGHKITLTPGARYIAGRPFASRGRTEYPVMIQEMAPTGIPWRDALTIDGLTYDAANRLLNAFNNGATSFEGRVW